MDLKGVSPVTMGGDVYRSTTACRVAILLYIDDVGSVRKTWNGTEIRPRRPPNLGFKVSKSSVRSPPRSLPLPMCLLHICSWSCLMVYRSNWFNWATSRCDCAWRNKCSIILRSVYGSQCHWSSVGFRVSGVWRSFCILAFFCIINKYVI